MKSEILATPFTSSRPTTMLSPSTLRRSSSASLLQPSKPSLCPLHHSLPSLHISPAISRWRCRPLRVQALDAAQPYDYESKMAATHFQSRHHLKIAILGFGNFGQFLAKTLVRQGHTVLAHSRSDHSHAAKSLGVSFFDDPHDLCEEHPEVVILCTSIISTQRVLSSFPLHRLKRSTLFVDVLSVKEFPRDLLLDLLPAGFDLICSHPMFGPQSARESWSGRFFVYEKVRIGDEQSRVSRCEKFLNVFASEGCKMMEMSCADHDKHVAESQFITHTVGRVLDMLSLESTPINTKGYETLFDLVENTAADSFDLYYGLFLYNKSALQMLERLDLALEALRNELFGRLHHAVRKQLFENAKKARHSQESYIQLLKRSQPGNGAALPSSSSLAVSTQDIAQPYENRGHISGQLDDSSRLKVAIVGFGNFGQFLAKTFVRQGHTVLAYSRTDYSDVAQKLGVSYFSDADDLCEEHPEVIVLCTSILSTEQVLRSLPFQRLKRSTLFVDVLSVKEFPRSLFLQNLPPDFDVLCTHPMFGPESGKNGWNTLPFVYDKVRIGSDKSRTSRCDRFLDIFAQEGCRMVEMSCAEHDWHAAGSQFITHTMGRVLEKLELKSTPINTKGYDTLLNLVENTAGDSFDLYYGLFMYNVNAMEQLERLDHSLESLKKQLFGRLHGVLQPQLFKNAENFQVSLEKHLLPKLSETTSEMVSSSETLDNLKDLS